MFAVSNDTKKGGRERKWVGRGTERRCLLLLLHFSISCSRLLQQAACSVGLCHHRALPFLAVLPLESNLLSSAEQGVRSHSLLVEVIFVPCLNLCTCASLLAQLSCFILLFVEAWHSTAAQMNQMHGQELGPWCSMVFRWNLSKYVTTFWEVGCWGKRVKIDPVAVFLNKKCLPWTQFPDSVRQWRLWEPQLVNLPKIKRIWGIWSHRQAHYCINPGSYSVAPLR